MTSDPSARSRADRGKALGRRGEDVAADYLRRRRMRIRERRFRIRGGEIDLVVEDGAELVFVEVKTRSSDRFMSPLEAVSAAKRRRVIRAAMVYLQRTGESDRPCRFDLVAVQLAPGGRAEVAHVPDAFRADGPQGRRRGFP